MSSSGKDAETKDQNKVRAKATGDLDKVTDYVEEREMDATKMEDSMRAMLGSTTARGKVDSSLSHVKIQQADVDLIVNELDMDPKKAEQALRKARGDVVKALFCWGGSAGGGRCASVTGRSINAGVVCDVDAVPIAGGKVYGWWTLTIGERQSVTGGSEEVQRV